MNARFLSISLSIAALALAASTGSFAQGRGGAGGMGNSGMGGMGGGASGSMQGGGGMPQGLQRGVESAPAQIDRSADPRSLNRRSSQDLQPQQPQQPQKTTQDLLQQNPKLSDNLSKLLPAGTDVNAAASGFGNLGEFVAAVHVSKNLGIPFADLKTKMMAGDSLGSAIEALKPEADGMIEARKAHAQADELTKG